MDRPNPFPKEYTEKELTDFLNTLSIPQSYAVIEKLYKDMRDRHFGVEAHYEQ